MFATRDNYKKTVKLSTEHYIRHAAAKDEHSGDPDPLIVGYVTSQEQP
jgi:hypothetical protein